MLRLSEDRNESAYGVGILQGKYMQLLDFVESYGIMKAGKKPSNKCSTVREGLYQDQMIKFS